MKINVLMGCVRCFEEPKQMKWIVGLVPFIAVPVAAAELTVSGFGSIVAAQVFEGDAYVAHYPSVARYEKSFNMIEESRLGVQSQVQFTPEASVTAQLTTRGSLDWQMAVEWFYLTYDVTPELRFQAGRMRLPAYLYSDFMDVGYAYTFIRVPGDAYSVDAVNYNGISFTHQTQWGQWDSSLQVYGGGESTHPNELMSYIRGFEHNRDYTDLYGAVWKLSRGAFTLRSSYLRTDISEEALNPSAVPVFVDPPGDFSIGFYDVAVLLDLNPFNVALEYNEYEYYTSWLASVSYSIKDWTFHATVSDFQLDEDWESHSSRALGLRYDLNANLAFKAQVDVFDDTGFNPFTGAANPVCHCADGDVTVLSAGVDFVF
jgi:hypothetical protein